MTRRVLHAHAMSRCVLALHDALAVCAVAFLLSFAFAQPAWAYVDPSVMTYTIQALAGVAVALSAVAGVAFRRSRKAIMRALNIDENANKEIDAIWKRIVYDEDNVHLDASHFEVAGQASTGAKHDAGAKKGPLHASNDKEKVKRPKFRPKWPWRFLLSLLVSAFVVITVFVMTSYETLAGNADVLVFGLDDAWQIVAMAAAIVAVAAAIIISLTRGAVFNFIIILLFAIGLCCYVQALFLNTGIPTTDGRAIDWSMHNDITIVSTIVWIAIIVLFVGVGIRFRKAIQFLAGTLAFALIVVQGVAIASLFADSSNWYVEVEEEEIPTDLYMITERGLFSVAPENNVIFFVLDTFDTTDLMRLLEEDPDLKGELAGFTWFKNSVGALSPTRYGAPFLWTGEYPQVDESFEDFLAGRYRRSTFLSDLQDLGYEVGLYTDTPGDTSLLTDKERHELIYDKTVNIIPPEPDYIETFNANGTLEILVRCALYRDMPWLAKPFFYFTTDQMNQAMVIDEPTNAEIPVPYVMNDAAWYEKLQERGLTVEEKEGVQGVYRYIHLQGTHEPYTLKADGTASDERTSLDEQAKGSMRMTIDYLKELKRLGLFEDATIIITADHGIWEEASPAPLPFVGSPVMLAKPAGRAGNVALRESDAEITAEDALATVIEAAGGDTANYGDTLFDQNEVDRDRRYILTFCTFGHDHALVEYSIKGDVLNKDNWSETGNKWVPEDE